MRVPTGVFLVLLALPLAARAQDRTPHVPKPEAVVHEAVRDAAEFEQWLRADQLLRDEARRAPQRPDLSYDVYAGIQQRNVQHAPRR